MNLFISKRNPLLEQRKSVACESWPRHFNKCTHVPPSKVEVDPDYQVCPLSVLTPIYVLGSKHSIEIVNSEAQSLLVIDDGIILWTFNGVVDIRRDFGEKHLTPSQVQNIHDMWPEPDSQKERERLFDYGPNFLKLGLLTRDGAIYSIDQDVEPPLSSR